MKPGESSWGARQRKRNGRGFEFQDLEPRRLLSVELISAPDPASFATAGGQSLEESVSHDGRFVAYMSTANDIVPGQDDRNSSLDVFLYDRVTKTNTLVSHTAANALVTAASTSGSPVISADGRYVAYQSQASDLQAGVTKRDVLLSEDVYLYDRITGLNTLVSHDSTKPLWTSEDGVSPNIAISADGRFIAFVTESSLVAGENDANGFSRDVVLYDRTTNTNVLVTHAASSLTTSANNHSAYDPSFALTGLVMSDDGAYVAYMSYATNLVAGETDPNYADSFYQQNAFLYERASGINRLMTHTAASSTESTSGVRSVPDISADGRYVAIEGGIAPGESGGLGIQATLYDRDTDTLSLVSHTPGAPQTEGMGQSTPLSMSDDGRYIVFESSATNLLTGQSGSGSTNDVFLFDRATNSNIMLSHASTGAAIKANNNSGDASISSDGRYVTFYSAATNLLTPLTTTSANIYLYDTTTNALTLVSHAPNGASVGGTLSPRISGDGHYIAFVSTAIGFVNGLVDANGEDDLFIYDAAVDANAIISSRAVDAPTQTTNSNSDDQGISADGRFVVFHSFASTLISGVTDTGGEDIFLRDRLLQKTTLLSHSYGTPTVAAGSSFSPQISANGAYVAFISGALNILSTPRQPNTASGQLMLYDRVADSLILATHSAGDINAQSNGSMADPSISADGRYITYSSSATNLMTGETDTNSLNDIFVYDRINNTSTLVSHAAGALLTASNGESTRPVISADGRYIVYQSKATNLVAGEALPAGTTINLYIFDRLTGLNTLVTHNAANPIQAANASADSGGFGFHIQPRMSDDGRYLLFIHRASDLVTGQIDTNNAGDVFLYDRTTNSSILVSHTATSALTAAGGVALNTADVADISGDGRYVVYLSTATTLASGITDTNSGADVFLFDRNTGNSTLVDHAYNLPNQAASSAATGNVAISDGGNFIGYSSPAGNLLASPYSPRSSSLLLYNVANNTSALATPSFPDNGSNAGSSVSAGERLSADGSVMVFNTNASRMVPNDFNDFDANSDVFAFVRTSPIDVSAKFSYALLPSTLRLTFSRDVGTSLAIADLKLQNLTQGTTVPSASMNLSYDSFGHLATVTFPAYPHGILPDGRYRITLPAGSVADTGGNALSSDFVYDFALLSGDTDHDGIVGDADLRTLLANMNTSLRTGATGDLNGDGRVDFLDFQIMEISYGKSLPPLAAPAPAKGEALTGGAKPAGSAGPLMVAKPSPLTLSKPSAAAKPPAPVTKSLPAASLAAVSPAAASPAPLSARVPGIAIFSTTPLKRRNDLLDGLP